MPANYSDQPVAVQQDFVNRIIANNWRNKFAKPLAQSLAITIAISLAVYGLVRAIGWVIGGFAASWGLSNAPSHADCRGLAADDQRRGECSLFYRQ